jgi:phosphate transport system ATP-binding protein
MASDITIKQLRVSYAGTEALHDINVRIPQRQLTVIIGPSGCGKTTLLKTINRLVDLNEEIKVKGDIMVGDLHVYDPGTDVTLLRKRVGYLSQNPYPLPMSIYDNVAFGLKIHKYSRSQVYKQLEAMEKDIIRQMGFKSVDDLYSCKREYFDVAVEYYLRLADLWNEVKDRLKSPASRLSIGQQQRLALARTLAIEPKVILADEPTSALDPVSAKLVEEQFRILKKKYTIVVVTHTLRQARRIADYVLFVYLGKLIEHGPAKKVFTKPENKMTRDYIEGEII